MKIRTIEVRRTVNLLEDPQPGWMALVDNGANQTPFTTVKHGRITSKETDEMAKIGKGSKAPAARLTKMQLSKSKFSTKKAVKTYLDENNIEGTGDIEDGDDVWIVKSTEDFSDVKLGKPKSTATKHEGVTAFIAPVLKADPVDDDEDEDEDEDGDDAETSTKGADDDDDDDAEDEDEDEDEGTAKRAASKVKIVDGETTKVRRAPAPRKKAAAPTPVLEFPGELATKYEGFGAYLSNEDSLTGVIADGMSYDDVPPGVEDVMMAAYHTIGNVLGGSSDKASKQAALVQLGADIARLSFGLFELFEVATVDSTKSASAKARKAAGAFVDSFSASIDRASDSETALKLFVNVDNDDEDEDDDKPVKGKKAAAPKVDPTASLLEKLTKTVGAFGSKLAGLEDTLSRGTVARSMSDSLPEIVGEDEEDEEADDAAAAARLQEVRRSMGLRGSSVADKVKA
jgi:hypothetical protein